jgi:hypothetical protein
MLGILVSAFILADFTQRPELAVLVGGAALLLLMVIAQRKRRNMPPGPRHNCPVCGYNLTGNQSGTCPECDTRFEVYARCGHDVSERVIRPIPGPEDDQND